MSSTTRKVGGFILTTAVPVPERPMPGGRPRDAIYPWAEMKVGESFFIEAADEKEARNTAAKLASSYNYYRKLKGKNTAWRTSVRKAGSADGIGVRVWRLEDGTHQTRTRERSKKTVNTHERASAHQ